MKDDAKGPILIAAAITLAATISTQYSKKGAKGAWFGPGIAVFIMLIFLFLLAEINAKLAILFAWLIAAGSLATNGQALFALLQSAQSGNHVAPSTTPLPWQLPNLNPLTAIGNAITGPITTPVGTLNLGAASKQPNATKVAGSRGSGYAVDHPQSGNSYSKH